MTITIIHGAQFFFIVWLLWKPGREQTYSSQVCMLCWDFHELRFLFSFHFHGRILLRQRMFMRKDYLTEYTFSPLSPHISFFPRILLKIIFLVQMRNRYITEECGFYTSRYYSQDFFIFWIPLYSHLLKDSEIF